MRQVAASAEPRSTDHYGPYGAADTVRVVTYITVPAGVRLPLGDSLFMRCYYEIEPDGTLVVRSVDTNDEMRRLKRADYFSVELLTAWNR